MANENTIVVVGNLTDDPELRYTPNGVAVANCRVAVNRRTRNTQTNEWEDRTDGFFTVNVWRDLAENVAESLHKGDRVMIQGSIRSRSWEDKEGQTRWVTEIEADEVCPSLRWARARIEKVRGGSSGGGGGQRTTPADRPPPADPPSSDDVPF